MVGKKIDSVLKEVLSTEILLDTVSATKTNQLL